MHYVLFVVLSYFYHPMSYSDDCQISIFVKEVYGVCILGWCWYDLDNVDIPIFHCVDNEDIIIFHCVWMLDLRETIYVRMMTPATQQNFGIFFGRLKAR